MFAQRETPTIIKTAMENVLDECDAIASQIATDLDAIPMTVWAEEVRIGNPVNFKNIDIDVQSSVDPTRSFITFKDEGGFIENVHLFLYGDVLEIVGPEDSENAQLIEVDDNTTGSAPADPSSNDFYTTVATSLPGGVDRTGVGPFDQKARLILRERTP
jgi:hypothetical protein